MDDLGERIHKPKKYCPCCKLKRIHCQKQAPTLLTRTHEIMRLEGTPINMARGVDPVRELDVFKIRTKPAIVSIIVKTQPTYASVWNRSTLDEILERMERTTIEEVEPVRFLEWSSDGCSLEFSVEVIVPFQEEWIGICELESSEQFVMVRCIDQESLQEEGWNVEPGKAILAEPNRGSLWLRTPRTRG